MRHDLLDMRPNREETRAAWGLAMAALSITLLLVAYFLPETFGVALGLAGFIGLFALRLTAGWDRSMARAARIPRRRSRNPEPSRERPQLRFAPE